MLATFGGNSAFVADLGAHNVEFLIVGGLAVVFYGCREPTQVDDLDLLLNPSLPNAERFVGVLYERGFQSVSADKVAKPNIQIPLKSRTDLYLDVLTPDRTISYVDLLSRSVGAVLASNIEVRIIGRTDLIEMKRKVVAKREVGVEKHERDLACLEAGAN